MSIRSTRQTNASKRPGAIDNAGRNRMIVAGGLWVTGVRSGSIKRGSNLGKLEPLVFRRIVDTS